MTAATLKQRLQSPTPPSPVKQQPPGLTPIIGGSPSKIHSKINKPLVEEEKSKQSPWTPKAQQYFMILSILCFMTRCFKLNDPQEVVFDEVHFGGFASNYLRREYFFDVHPPLGKLIIAATGWLCGYDGSFTFASIGLPYAGTAAPFTTMRFVMAAFGWATVALSFATLLEMGFSLMSATFAASLIIFGKPNSSFQITP